MSVSRREFFKTAAAVAAYPALVTGAAQAERLSGTRKCTDTEAAEFDAATKDPAQLLIDEVSAALPGFRVYCHYHEGHQMFQLHATNSKWAITDFVSREGALNAGTRRSYAKSFKNAARRGLNRR